VRELGQGPQGGRRRARSFTLNSNEILERCRSRCKHVGAVKQSSRHADRARRPIVAETRIVPHRGGALLRDVDIADEETGLPVVVEGMIR